VAGAAAAGAGGISAKVIALLVVGAAGGVATGIVLARRGDGNKPIVITAGTATVGQPQ
jgi:hypothetical protein